MSILPKDFRGTMVSAFASSTVFTSLFYATYLGLEEMTHFSQKVKLSYEAAFFLLYCYICYKNVQAANKLAKSKVIIYYFTLTLLKTVKNNVL